MAKKNRRVMERSTTLTDTVPGHIREHCGKKNLSDGGAVFQYPKQTREIDTMMKSSVKPTVVGTRSGYVIRFTCPSCFKQNSIVYNMPKACYKVSRDATCAQCKKHITVLTSGQ
ncbi:MAG: hypothetical protein LUQ25_06000 [Methanoregulaceae archaeon]|nr:hypothetical protein [Methanoregulaceae archaeon]